MWILLNFSSCGKACGSHGSGEYLRQRASCFSQAGEDRVDVAEIVAVADSVWVKVIDIDVEKQKISLSMKYVDQQTGQDLDAFQVRSSACLERSSCTAGRLMHMEKTSLTMCVVSAGRGPGGVGAFSSFSRLVKCLEGPGGVHAFSS